MKFGNDEITIKKNQKAHNQFEVKMKVTEGKLLSILYALETHNTPVGNDMYDMLKTAMKEAGINI